MTDVLWDENAEAAYEAGRIDGVWVVFFWPDGWDAEIHVFEHESDARVQALIFAQKLWDAYWDEDGDWPPMPETWSEIYDEVLEHLGNAGDVLTVEHKEIKG